MSRTGLSIQADDGAPLKSEAQRGADSGYISFAILLGNPSSPSRRTASKTQNPTQNETQKISQDILDGLIGNRALGDEELVGLRKFLSVKVTSNVLERDDLWANAEQHLPSALKKGLNKSLDERIRQYSGDGVAAAEHAILILEPLTGAPMLISDTFSGPLSVAGLAVSNPASQQILNALSFAILPIGLIAGLFQSWWNAPKRKKEEQRFLSALKLLIAQEMICDYLMSPALCYNATESLNTSYLKPQQNENQRKTESQSEYKKNEKLIRSAKREGAKAGAMVFISMTVFAISVVSALHSAFNVDVKKWATKTFHSVPVAIAALSATILVLSIYYGYVYHKKAAHTKHRQRKFHAIKDSIDPKIQNVFIQYQKQMGLTTKGSDGKHGDKQSYPALTGGAGLYGTSSSGDSSRRSSGSPSPETVPRPDTFTEDDLAPASAKP